MGLDFANFRRKLNASFSKKKWASISHVFVENVLFSNKTLASISLIFVENAPISNKKWASISHFFVESAPISNKKWAAWKIQRNDFDTGLLAFPRYVSSSLRGWPCRVVSAVCFFVLILNNAGKKLKTGGKKENIQRCKGMFQSRFFPPKGRM